MLNNIISVVGSLNYNRFLVEISCYENFNDTMGCIFVCGLELWELSVKCV